MKRPSFQFYPADWRKDPAVQSLTYEERGVWIEMLCIMHESEIPGKLILGGLPYPNERLARLLGLSLGYLEVIITSLITLNVASICPETGAIMNRRMVRDREISATRSETGSKGGNPNFSKGKKNPYYDKQKDNQLHNQKDNQKITPSSSSSSSTSVFKKPSVDDVLSYGQELNPPFTNASGFIDHYTANGWKVGGKAAMKDWKAAVRTWHRNERNATTPTTGKPQSEFQRTGVRSLFD
jgi:hypothetical protein